MRGALTPTHMFLNSKHWVGTVDCHYDCSRLIHNSQSTPGYWYALFKSSRQLWFTVNSKLSLLGGEFDIQESAGLGSGVCIWMLGTAIVGYGRGYAGAIGA